MARTSRGRAPPPNVLLKLDQHRRWLYSGGREGTRLGTAPGEEIEILDFQGLDLDGLDLSAACLNSHDFSNGSLRFAWLVGAELDGAIFSGCDVTHSRFDRAILSSANFIGAKGIMRAKFELAYTKETIWTPADAHRKSDAFSKENSIFWSQARSWGKAEWDAFHRRSDVRWKRAQGRDATLVRGALARWRKARLASMAL